MWYYGILHNPLSEPKLSFVSRADQESSTSHGTTSANATDSSRSITHGCGLAATSQDTITPEPKPVAWGKGATYLSFLTQTPTPNIPSLLLTDMPLVSSRGRAQGAAGLKRWCHPSSNRMAHQPKTLHPCSETTSPTSSTEEPAQISTKHRKRTMILYAFGTVHSLSPLIPTGR